MRGPAWTMPTTSTVSPCQHDQKRQRNPHEERGAERDWGEVKKVICKEDTCPTETFNNWDNRTPLLNL